MDLYNNMTNECDSFFFPSKNAIGTVVNQFEAVSGLLSEMINSKPPLVL